MRILKLIALCMVLACNAGCLSSIGASTLGSAGSKAPVSFSREGVGKGESYWLAQYDDVVEATVRAGEVLSLTVDKKELEEDQAFFRFSDDKARRIDLFIERRTATMTSIRFNVGRSGSVAFGRLMARQIINELDKSGAFLEEYTSVIQD